MVTNNMTNPFPTMAINRLEILAAHFPSLTGQECFELISREIACLKEIRDSWEEEFSDEPVPKRQCDAEGGSCTSCE